MVISDHSYEDLQLKRESRVKIQNAQYEKKKNAREYNVGARACAERNRGLKRNVIEGVALLGQDPTRLILLQVEKISEIFYFCKATQRKNECKCNSRRWGQILSQEDNETWQHWPHGSDFSVVAHTRVQG